MKARNMSVTLLFVIATLAMVASAGTVTMVHPATSDRFEVSTIGGLIILNASADFNATWCAFYGSSASTVNSSSTIVIANVTHGYDFTNNSVNSSINSRLFEDANDYTWSATCSNQSGTTYDATATTSVVLDNTVPTVPTVNTPAGYTEEDGALNLNATVLGNQTTGCTLRFIGTLPIGVGSSITITETSGTSLCTRVISGPVGNGVFRYTFTANDGTNTSSESSAQDLIVTIDGNRKRSLVITPAVAEQAGVSTGTGMSPLAIIALLAAGGYVLSQLGKKRR